MQSKERVDLRDMGRTHWTLCAHLWLVPWPFGCFWTPPLVLLSEQAVTSHPSLSALLPVGIPSSGALPRRPADSWLNSIGCNYIHHTAQHTESQPNTCDSTCALLQTSLSEHPALHSSLSLPPFPGWGHSCTACHWGSPPQLLFSPQPPSVDLSPGWSQQWLWDRSHMWGVQEIVVWPHLDLYDSSRKDCDDPLFPSDLQRDVSYTVCDGPPVCVKDGWGNHTLGLGQCHRGIPEGNKMSFTKS